MESEFSQREPRPITWAEQRRLLPHLADDLAKMVSFDLNTGALDEVVCGLKWEWETHIPEPSFPLFFVFQRSDIMPPILSHADC